MQRLTLPLYRPFIPHQRMLVKVWRAKRVVITSLPTVVITSLPTIISWHEIFVCFWGWINGESLKFMLYTLAFLINKNPTCVFTKFFKTKKNEIDFISLFINQLRKTFGIMGCLYRPVIYVRDIRLTSPMSNIWKNHVHFISISWIPRDTDHIDIHVFKLSTLLVKITYVFIWSWCDYVKTFVTTAVVCPISRAREQQ